jgi:hypothetical protein
MRQHDDRPEEHPATNVLIRSKPNSRVVSSKLIILCSLLQGEANFLPLWKSRLCAIYYREANKSSEERSISDAETIGLQ